LVFVGACSGAPTPGSPPAAEPQTATGQAQGAAPAAPVLVRMALPTIDLNYLLPLSVAEAQGFFREEGVQVEWQQMTTTAAIPAQLNGEVDLASGGSGIAAAMQGAPLRAMFFQYNTSTFQFAVNSSKVREPRDLVGQTVAIASVGNTQDIATRLIIKSLGVDPLAVNYLAAGGERNRVAALLSGQVVGSAVNPSVAADLKPQGFAIMANSAAVMPIPFSGFGAHIDYIRDQGPTLRSWMRAMIRALRFARQEPEAAAEIASRALEMDVEIARESMPLLLAAMDPNDPGGFSEGGMLEQIRILRERDPDLGEVTIEQVADVGPLREVQRALGIRCSGGYKCP
jgi:NitT/TauT family transport system substrate-binding protein